MLVTVACYKEKLHTTLKKSSTPTDKTVAMGRGYTSEYNIDYVYRTTKGQNRNLANLHKQQLLYA